MDVVTLFAIVVFVTAWFFYARTPAEEPLVRLFCASLLGMAAFIGVSGFILRQLQ